MGECKETADTRKGEGRLLAGPFGALACAQALSLTGEAVVRFALPLHVLNVTGQAVLYGAVTAVGLAAYVALMPLGGVVADRAPRRLAMAALDALLALACVVYLVLQGVCDTVALCACVLVAAYGAQGAYQPCAQSCVASVLPRGQVGRGVAVMSQVGSLAGVAGPVLGGVLFGVAGVVPAVALSAGAFVVAGALTCLRLRIPSGPRDAPAPTGGGAARSVAGDLAAALRFLRGERVLGACVAGAAGLNLATTAFMTVAEPYMVTELLGLPNALVGVAEALTCAGALAGGALVAARPGFVGVRGAPRAVLACVPGMLAAALACAPGVGAGAAFCLLAAGFAWVALCCSVVSVVTVAHVQLSTPHDLVGKVLALAMAASGCASPAGQALYGLALDAAPAWAVALVAAGATAAVALAWGRALARG